MLALKHLLTFTAWIAFLGGAFTALNAGETPFHRLPMLVAWCVYITFALFSLLDAIAGNTNDCTQWVGAAVFSVASVLIFSYSETYSVETIGGILVDYVFLPEAIDNDRYQRDWNALRTSLTSLCDLVTASMLTAFSFIFGASVQRSVLEKSG